MTTALICEPISDGRAVLLHATQAAFGYCTRMDSFSPIEPGQRVRHPARPDWGVGQVQSVIGGRVTVNFPHAGKVLINAEVVAREFVEAPARFDGE